MAAMSIVLLAACSTPLAHKVGSGAIPRQVTIPSAGIPYLTMPEQNRSARYGALYMRQSHPGEPLHGFSASHIGVALTEPYHHDSHMSYYGGDGKLRVFNRHIGVSDRSEDSTYGERGTFDEYRYDALGRRVLTRTRRIGVGCPSTLDCQSRVTRTVWDGDQVLYEIKAPAGEIIDSVPTPPDSSEELSSSIRFLVKSEAGEENSRSAFTVDTTTDPQIESDAEFVSYSYAPGVLGVDEPIEIHKGSETVIPHTGWRGMLAMGTYPDGTPSDCAVANPCTRIDWPAMNVTTDGAGYNRAEPSTWYGSLASTGTEGSDLQYMRNRYYDPKRGQFTQADPIGLGGGLNLYGFAEGDAINFSDPFGLCPPCFPGMPGMRRLSDESTVKGLAILGAVTVVVTGAIATPQLAGFVARWLSRGGSAGAARVIRSTATIGARIEPTAGQMRLAAETLESGGQRALERAVRTWTQRLAQHEGDLQRYKAAGGYTSKTISEIRNFRGLIEAARRILQP